MEHMPGEVKYFVWVVIIKMDAWWICIQICLNFWHPYDLSWQMWPLSWALQWFCLFFSAQEFLRYHVNAEIGERSENKSKSWARNMRNLFGISQTVICLQRKRSSISSLPTSLFFPFIPPYFLVNLCVLFCLTITKFNRGYAIIVR